jgi:3-hydroxyisobutyrate dehydrogenase-like beta-hydroxyacid dehydrogenase
MPTRRIIEASLANPNIASIFSTSETNPVVLLHLNTSMSSTQGVTFIGVGNMGSAAIQALLRANFAVTIWNRTKARLPVDAAIAAGAVFEPDLRAAIAKHNVIFICVLDYSKIASIFATLQPSTSDSTFSALKDKVIINLTNGTPGQARSMDLWFKMQGAQRYFDGAVMVTPQMVSGQHSFLVVSGEHEAAAGEIEHLLSPIGNPQFLGGDVGAAACFDVAALASMYGMFAGSFLGMALLKKGSGPSPSSSVLSSSAHTTPHASSGKPSSGAGSQIGSVVAKQIVPFLTALVPYLSLIADAWDAGNWKGNMGNPMGMQVEALHNIMAACEEEGIDGRLLAEMQRLMGRVVREFGEDAGITALGTYLFK